MMNDTRCAQCNRNVTFPACRLVQDTCGHAKCRVCLLQDEDGCLQCKQNAENHPQEISSVIKYENSQLSKESGCEDTAKTIERIETSPNIPLENDLPLESDEKMKGKHVSVTNNVTKTVSKTTKRNYQPLVIPDHITVLKDPVSYKCNVCKKGFQTKSNIKYHMYCNGGSKPLQCSDCKKEFISKSHLKIHSYIHIGVKPFACNICKKSFSANSKLSRHKQLHAKVGLYMCQECGKSYNSKDSLKIHLYGHSGEKPYKCGKCEARFTNSSNLKKHLVSHSSEKVHMCDQCGKRFKLKWALTVHHRSHLRIRPYACTNCSKTFVNAKDLNRHQLIHMDVKAYSCGICNVGFRRKDNLDRHMRNTHPGNYAKPIKNNIKPFLLKHAKPTTTDNPNAINVITSSRAQLNSSSSNKTTSMNMPVKLAFKTSTFKSNYNLNREEPLQEIQGTHPRKTFGNVTEQESTAICQRIMGPCHPLHYETSFEHKKHAVIKNIKFKLPPEYINMKSDFCTVPLQPVENLHLDEDCQNKDNIYTELKTVQATTSVIVKCQTQENSL